MDAKKREMVIKALEGLAPFTTCPEYIKDALALIKELTEENERVRAEKKAAIEDLRKRERELTQTAIVPDTDNPNVRMANIDINKLHGLRKITSDNIGGNI